MKCDHNRVSIFFLSDATVYYAVDPVLHHRPGQFCSALCDVHQQESQVPDELLYQAAGIGRCVLGTEVFLIPLPNSQSITFRSECGTAQRADRHRLALHRGLEGGQPGLQGHPLLAGRRHILVHLRPGGHEHRQIRRHQAPHELLKVV